MASNDDVTCRFAEEDLSEAIKSIDSIMDQIDICAGQRLTTKQFDSLKADLTSLRLCLSGAVPKLHRSRDAADDRFNTMTSGIGSTLDGSEYDKEHYLTDSELIEKLRADRLQLQEEVKELEQELNRAIRADHNERLIDSSYSSQSLMNTSADFTSANQELNRCKETLQAMKADRSRLKSENLDLQLELKQLHCNLNDKEAELRDFIRNYDQRKKEHADTVKVLTEERDKSDQEKRDLTKRMREAIEQNLQLRSQLELKEEQMIKMHQEFRRTMTQQKSATLSSVVRGCLPEDMMRRQFVPAVGSLYNSFNTVDPNCGCSRSGFALDNTYSWCSENMEQARDIPSYQHIYQVEESPTLPPRTASITEGQLEATREKAVRHANLIRSKTNSSYLLNRGWSISGGSRDALSNVPGDRSSLGLTQTPSTIDEVDSRPNSPPPIPPVPTRISFLSADNYEIKRRTLEEAKLTPVVSWRAHHVLAWLELELGMTAFGQICSDNIKSGKVLMDLSDVELESALKLPSPLHRRKMRLAIEELRDPSSIQCPNACRIDHIWVSHDWIYSLGLSQYSAACESHLVDGRLLRILSKKDLEKYLGLKKFHLYSFQYGVELLRMFQFNKEALQERRSQSKQSEGDPLVWSNQQVIQWADRIDLREYSKNLRDSGVHGAVLVLDNSFTADSLASVLAIPNSKSYVRRHLATELDNIVKPAREALKASRTSRENASAFVRSLSPANRFDTDHRKDHSRSSGSSKRHSLRGSFGKAFSGKKSVKESSSFGSENQDHSQDK